MKLPARSSINVTPLTLFLLHLQDSRHSTASLKFIFGCGCLAHGLNYRKGRTSSCKELTATVLLLNGWWLPLSAVLRVRAFTNLWIGAPPEPTVNPEQADRPPSGLYDLTALVQIGCISWCLCSLTSTGFMCGIWLFRAPSKLHRRRTAYRFVPRSRRNS